MEGPRGSSPIPIPARAPRRARGGWGGGGGLVAILQDLHREQLLLEGSDPELVIQLGEGLRLGLLAGAWRDTARVQARGMVLLGRLLFVCCGRACVHAR